MTGGYYTFGASRGQWIRPSRSVEVYTDPKHGSLRIDLLPSGESPTEAELDENEVFVFYEIETNRVVGFEIHAFQSYWTHRIDELASILAEYAPEYVSAIKLAIYQNVRATDAVGTRDLAFA